MDKRRIDKVASLKGAIHQRVSVSVNIPGYGSVSGVVMCTSDIKRVCRLRQLQGVHWLVNKNFPNSFIIPGHGGRSRKRGYYVFPDKGFHKKEIPEHSEFINEQEHKIKTLFEMCREKFGVTENIKSRKRRLVSVKRAVVQTVKEEYGDLFYRDAAKNYFQYKNACTVNNLYTEVYGDALYEQALKFCRLKISDL
jgi:hypothetical protein